MIELIQAAEEDLLRIIEIENEAFSPPWTHGTLLGEVYREDSLFLCAKEGGVILGYMVLRLGLDDGELLSIAVEKSARRRGVADKLLDAALRYAMERAQRSVFLEVRTGNEAAIALYKKHGFAPVGRRKAYYIDPVEDALVLRKVNK